ncbi:MAG TPA: hypothetical protein PLQ76_08025, partial [bacterium]|nr:hypothetical protein [bacterium]
DNMKKTIFVSVVITAAMLALFLTGKAYCQMSVFGKISSVDSDGSVTINAGRNAGFEEGDILVVQRQNLKVGLAHIDRADAEKSLGTMIKVEDGMSVKAGDLAAYQMLSGSQGLPPDEPVPSIMKREWLTPQAKITNYDDEINKNLDILKRSAGDRAAMIRLADAYFKKGWYQHSIKWYQSAVEQKTKAEDNDKLLYQIIRSYGYLNQPDKQQLYMDFLTKYYPDSVFVSMKARTAIRVPSENLLPGFKKVYPPIKEDTFGFRKGGMRIIEKGGMDEMTGPVRDLTPDISGKLLHAQPGLLTPQSNY